MVVNAISTCNMSIHVHQFNSTRTRILLGTYSSILVSAISTRTILFQNVHLDVDGLVTTPHLPMAWFVQSLDMNSAISV